MENLLIEGDIEGVHEKQQEFVKKILQERSYDSGTITVSVVGKAGDNYVANVKRFVFEKNGKKFSMVGKVAPVSEIQRTLMNTKCMFQNEHVMYTQVLPKLTELEKEAGIPETERLKYAQCYGSFTEEPYEIILLEDLRVSEFEMLDRFKSFTNDSVRLVLKNFARLHSLSFVLKHHEPEFFDALSNQLVNPWALMGQMPDVDKYFGQMENDVLELLPNEDDKKRIRGSMIEMVKISTQNYEIDRKLKHSVIVQGDSWTNNIMFQLKDGVPSECCMIDYQISNQNNLVNDILYMIFNCTNYETRTKFYHDWIAYYHFELGGRLSKFGININEVYPRAVLDSDLKRLSKISFGLCVMLATVLIRESHEAADLQEAMRGCDTDELLKMAKLDKMETNTLNRFKERLEGLITSFIELGYID